MAQCPLRKFRRNPHVVLSRIRMNSSGLQQPLSCRFSWIYLHDVCSCEIYKRDINKRDIKRKSSNKSILYRDQWYKAFSEGLWPIFIPRCVYHPTQGTNGISLVFIPVVSPNRTAKSRNRSVCRWWLWDIDFLDNKWNAANTNELTYPLLYLIQPHSLEKHLILSPKAESSH